MQMTKFKVTNYRCIEDSDWIELEDIAVIVGKNESGKTSILKALWKFNPYDNSIYEIETEWPRAKWESRRKDQVVVTARFRFNENEKKILCDLEEDTFLEKLEGVQITKNYSGDFNYSFFPISPRGNNDGTWLKLRAAKDLGSSPEGSSEVFKGIYDQAFKNLVAKIPEVEAYNTYKKLLDIFKADLIKKVNASTAREVAEGDFLPNIEETINQSLNTESPWRKATNLVKEWLPVFIYMDDHKAFTGSTDLEEIKNREDNDELTSEDNTTIMIMKMAGLDLEKVVLQGQGQDKRARTLDIKVGSEKLTQMMAPHWSQNCFKVQFRVDDQHFSTYILDDRHEELIALEEKSQGFQWYFTFDLMFRYETNGQFKGAIILLDEPGLHLHASAQADLLKRMKDYSEGNQLIYTTHLPFMIDYKKWENIYIAEHFEQKGTKAHKDWHTADKDARFTLLAAIGISWSNSILYNKYSLIVEGISDYNYITAFSDLFESEGLEFLDPDLGITYSGGGGKAAYLATLLNGQNIYVAMLLDHDQEGQNAQQQVLTNKILSSQHVLMISDITETNVNCSIEDLFEEDYYLSCIKRAYKKELGKKILLLPKTSKPIIDKTSEAFAAKGLGKFNKARVAKVILKDLTLMKSSELPTKTIENFQKLISVLNKIVGKWKL